MDNEKIDKTTGEITEASGTPMGNPRPFYIRGVNVARKIIHPTCNDRMAKQEFKKECDINIIMEKYKATGLLPQQVQNIQGHFANFNDVEDYYTACTKAADAQKAFDTLPSKMRRLFDNDPAKLVNFVTNPKNELAAAKMGLLTEEARLKAFQKAAETQKTKEQKIAENNEKKKKSAPPTDQSSSD